MLHRETPDTDLHKGEPVGGEFAVAGTLPTIQDVIDFKEGVKQYEYGYYRFVHHPYLRQIAGALQSYSQARHCLLTGSVDTALMELLDYLIITGTVENIVIIEDPGVPQEWGWNKLLSSLDAEIHHFGNAESALYESNSIGNKCIWIFSGIEAIESYNSSSSQNTHQFPTQGKRIFLSEQPIEGLPELGRMSFYVTGLSPQSSPLFGGAILSNSDRIMMQFGNRMKRRGPLLSSRNAAVFIGKKAPDNFANTPVNVEKRLVKLEEGRDAFLYPSGMNAIATALDLVVRPGRNQVISVGHLYTDTYSTLRYQQKENTDKQNIFLGVDEIEKLEKVLTDQTAAVITETITNPLNDVPDLERIARMVKPYDIPIIVDNSIATPCNCQPLNYGADIVVHSTTKFFSGANDHAGGAIIVNSAALADKLRNLQHRWNNKMSPLEANILWEHLQNFEERMNRFNKNAVKVAEFLDKQPSVDTVYFSGLPNHRSYPVAKRLLKGHSSVISFTLENDTVYDYTMEHIIKAPTLGSDHTLLCPYVMIAHYNEPESVLEELGLSKYLLRIAVGCEPDITPVLNDLDKALN